MKTSILVLLFAVFFSCHESDRLVEGTEPGSNTLKGYSNDVILDWNRTAHKTMAGPTYDPLVASRIQAQVHIAMHDALNNISGAYETYALKDEDKKAHPIAAAASAAHTVLVVTFPDKKNMLDSALQVSFSKIPAGNSLESGVALGIKAGNAILSEQPNEDIFQNPVGEIPVTSEPGVYQAVPPTPFVYAPFWAKVKTFSLENPSQFRVANHPTIASEEYVNDFNEVKSKGAKDGSSRTLEETSIAMYWYELSEIGWNRITLNVATEKKTDLLTTARLFALVNMALADSYTAGWDSKFYYNFWRPYTAIRTAENDGNSNTTPDIGWESLLDTPPVQDYPSTHSVLGNAAATILASLLGDNTTFTMSYPSAHPEHPNRTFNSFSSAAVENAESRVLAGLHFRFSCTSGLDLGKKIGEWTVKNHLRPVKDI